MTVTGFDIDDHESMEQMQSMDVGGWVFTTRISCDSTLDILDVRMRLPDTVIAGMIGRSVGQIIDHQVLRDEGIAEMVVIDAGVNHLDEDFFCLQLESAA